MIIPTAEYNPLFAADGVPFREKMVDYIKAEFGDLLGPQAELLDRAQGLEDVKTRFAGKPFDVERIKDAA